MTSALDAPAQFLLLVAVAVAGVIVVAVTSDAQKVRTLLALSVPQIYLVQVGGVYVSLALLLTLLCAPVAVLRLVRCRPPGTLAVGCYLLAEAVATAWSPDPLLGVRSIVYQLPFVVALALTVSTITSTRSTEPVRWLGAAAVPVVGLAVMVIAFRLLPPLEEDFLHSTVARLFVNPNTLAELFDVGQNNVLDPAKAGGVFTNANVAAAFLGVAFLALAAAFDVTRRRRHLGSAVLAWTAVIATGSGMAIILAVAAPLVYVALRPARPATGRVVALLTGAGLLAGAQILGYADLAPGKELSASSRLLIWQFAAREFLDRPVLGHGFGGWRIAFAAFAARTTSLRATFPPHNSVIYLWSEAGLFGAVAGVGTVAVLLAAMMRARSLPGGTSRAVSSAAITALLWITVHGQVENFGLFGDEHVQPLLALLVALGVGQQVVGRQLVGQQIEEVRSGAHGDQTDRGRVPEPAVASVRGFRHRAGP